MLYIILIYNIIIQLYLQLIIFTIIFIINLVIFEITQQNGRNKQTFLTKYVKITDILK